MKKKNNITNISFRIRGSLKEIQLLLEENINVWVKVHAAAAAAAAAARSRGKVRES